MYLIFFLISCYFNLIDVDILSQVVRQRFRALELIKTEMIGNTVVTSGDSTELASKLGVTVCFSSFWKINCEFGWKCFSYNNKKTKRQKFRDLMDCLLYWRFNVTVVTSIPQSEFVGAWKPTLFLCCWKLHITLRYFWLVEYLNFT